MLIDLVDLESRLSQLRPIKSFRSISSNSLLDISIIPVLLKDSEDK